MSVARTIERWWYQPRLRAPLVPLLPLEWLYRLLIMLRRGWQKKRAVPQLTPVIVVGNIAVGGTGKTPLVIAVVRWLQSQGYKPGVISRGYGGNAAQYPCVVHDHSAPVEVGDEPLLIHRSTGAPVVVDPNRVAALSELESRFGCNVVVSDDGLQHYALARDIEIAVIDGLRGLGNRHCLPVGPLREPPARLTSVDILVVNGESGDTRRWRGYSMHLEPNAPINLASGRASSDLPKTLHAVAGIGNPRRFFTTLIEMGFQPLTHAFPDHHAYTPEELIFDDDLPVIMTEKDAIKCRGFAGEASERLWYLPVTAALPAQFFETLHDKLESLSEENL